MCMQKCESKLHNKDKRESDYDSTPSPRQRPAAHFAVVQGSVVEECACRARDAVVFHRDIVLLLDARRRRRHLALLAARRRRRGSRRIVGTGRRASSRVRLRRRVPVIVLNAEPEQASPAETFLARTLLAPARPDVFQLVEFVVIDLDLEDFECVAVHESEIGDAAIGIEELFEPVEEALRDERDLRLLLDLSRL